MTFFAFLIAIAAFLTATGMNVRLQALEKKLKGEEERNKELTHTLAQVLDGDGNVCGQLMLPGEVTTGEAVKMLGEAEESLKEAKDEIASYRKSIFETQKLLDAARSREEKLEKTLAEVVDKDGGVLVELRLPGERVMPNRTPCGELCKHALWDKRVAKYRCMANQGIVTNHSREQFLDANNQCVMWEERKKEEKSS